MGIDGGGTKTDMVLSNQHCKILARIKCGQSNLHNATEKEISDEMKKGINMLIKKAGLKKTVKFSSVGIGLAGLDTQQDEEIAARIFRNALKGHMVSFKNMKIVNDTIIGFWSGTTSEEGMCIIGGTGSNCYGRTKRGKEAKASGRGHILADQGSGYEIGMKALKAAVKSFDGRGPKTKLEKMVLKHFMVKNFDDLMGRVYYQPFNKHDAGQLAIVVQNAAEAGDKVARKIAYEAADELFLMVKTVGHKLGFKKGKEFDLVMIGGVIQHDPYVKIRFKNLVRKIYPQVNFIIPDKKPVIGAVRLAMSMINGKAARNAC